MPWLDDWFMGITSGDPDYFKHKEENKRPNQTRQSRGDAGSDAVDPALAAREIRDRVERTYYGSNYDDWSNAVKEYASNNEQIFGSADTCADMEKNVLKYLQSQGFRARDTDDRSYEIQAGKAKIHLDNLDDLIQFATGVKIAQKKLKS